MSINPAARLENLHWPLMIVKLRKGEKYFKIFEKQVFDNRLLCIF